jgi:hypothetical protein
MFLKIEKQKFHFKFQKQNFFKFFISNFHGINKFFLWLEVAKFLKRLQKLPIYPYQNSHIMHTTTIKEPLTRWGGTMSILALYV